MTRRLLVVPALLRGSGNHGSLLPPSTTEVEALHPLAYRHGERRYETSATFAVADISIITYGCDKLLA